MKTKNLLFFLIAFIYLTIFSSCQSNNHSNKQKLNNETNENLTIIKSNPQDDLVGEFTTEEGGKAILKITKKTDNYFVSFTDGGNQSPSGQLTNIKDKDLLQDFGGNWKEYVEAGLGSGTFGIFKIKKGYKSQDHTYKTGYFLMYFGSGDLFKIK